MKPIDVSRLQGWLFGTDCTDPAELYAYLLWAEGKCGLVHARLSLGAGFTYLGMTGLSRERIEAFRPVAEKIAEAGQDIRLYRFVLGEAA